MHLGSTTGDRRAVKAIEWLRNNRYLDPRQASSVISGYLGKEAAVTEVVDGILHRDPMERDGGYLVSCCQALSSNSNISSRIINSSNSSKGLGSITRTIQCHVTQAPLSPLALNYDGNSYGNNHGNHSSNRHPTPPSCRSTLSFSDIASSETKEDLWWGQVMASPSGES